MSREIEKQQHRLEAKRTGTTDVLPVRIEPSIVEELRKAGFKLGKVNREYMKPEDRNLI